MAGNCGIFARDAGICVGVLYTPPRNQRCQVDEVLHPAAGEVELWPDRCVARWPPSGLHGGHCGKLQLWVRPLDSTEARELAGTQGAIFPFWSPDSRFIGFFADSRLKKIEVTGGPVQTLCEVPLPLGGAWSSAGGVIIFGPQSLIGLLRTSTTGGEVTQMTTIDRSRQEITHRYPTFLPDGRHFLYSIMSGEKETRGVYVGSLAGTIKRRLMYD